MATHPVSDVVGLLGGRGLVLGWTPETQKLKKKLINHLAVVFKRVRKI